MKTKIYYLKVILLSTFFFVSCNSQNLASPPPPPPPPDALEMMSVMKVPASVVQAKKEFRNFRRAMGYVDGFGREVDKKNGYFDINIQTLKALYDEAVGRGWKDIRVYNGIDSEGNRTLLINGLQLNGGLLEETSKADGDIVAKISNPPTGGSSDCPRYCDITGTVIGR